MTVLTLAGKAIDWSHPPKPTDRVMWSHRTSGGKKVTGSFRSICHLEHMSILSKKKFNGQGIVVIQSAYNTGVRASAGTHDYDACFDGWIPGVAWSEQQSFFRANGAGAYWRRPPSFGNHIHWFCLPPREGVSIADDYAVHGFKVGKYVDGGISTSGRKYTSAQIEDYYNHRTALAGHARDNSWFPADIAATVFDLEAFVLRQRGLIAPPPKVVKPNPNKKGLNWKGKRLTVNGPFFMSAPRQHHWSPKVGDRLSAWKTVKAGEALDGNLTPGAGQVWFLHTGTPRGDGYTRVVDAKTKRVRPMTNAELGWSLDRWGQDGIRRWRDSHGQHPMTLAEGLRWLVQHDVYGALEVKGPHWGTNPRWFQFLRVRFDYYDHPAMVKRIATLRVPRETVINAHAANVKIAAIYGKSIVGRARRLAATARISKNWKGVEFDATW